MGFWDELLDTVKKPKQVDASNMLHNKANESYVSPRQFFVDGKTPPKDNLVSEASYDLIDGRDYTARNEAPGGQPIEEWYEDSEGNQTIGLGHKRRDDIDYSNWDSQSPMDQFHKDYDTAQNYAKNMLNELWDGIPNDYQDIVTDMVFNMGGANVKKNFQGFLAALTNQDYERAAQELEWVDPDDKSKGRSKFYKQTGTRAKKHQKLLRR